MSSEDVKTECEEAASGGPGQHDETDRFVAEIGCIDGSEDCNARFTLSYKEVGTSTIVQLGSWVERYDDSTTVIDLDVSSLAGMNVKFILQVESLSNQVGTEVFWFVPRIQNP